MFMPVPSSLRELSNAASSRRQGGGVNLDAYADTQLRYRSSRHERSGDDDNSSDDEDEKYGDVRSGVRPPRNGYESRGTNASQWAQEQIRDKQDAKGRSGPRREKTSGGDISTVVHMYGEGTSNVSRRQAAREDVRRDRERLQAHLRSMRTEANTDELICNFNGTGTGTDANQYQGEEKVSSLTKRRDRQNKSSTSIWSLATLDDELPRTDVEQDEMHASTPKDSPIFDQNAQGNVMGRIGTVLETVLRDPDRLLSPPSSLRPSAGSVSQRSLASSNHRSGVTTVASVVNKVDVKPEEKKVRFTNVEIRSYERILGDHPCCSGPPISIGWSFDKDATRTCTVQEHQRSKQRGNQHVGSDCPIISRSTRVDYLLDLGYSDHDLAKSVRVMQRVKRQRRQTVQNLSVMDVEEKMEKCKRGVKRVVSRKNAPMPQRTMSEEPSSTSSTSSATLDNELSRADVEQGEMHASTPRDSPIFDQNAQGDFKGRVGTVLETVLKDQDRLQSRLDALRSSAGSVSRRSLASSNHQPGVDVKPEEKKVHFTNVEIRSYERILGDHPSVSEGPPMSIGWRFDKDVTRTCTVQEHQRSKQRGDQQVGSDCPILSRSMRVDYLLDLGYSDYDLAKSVRVTQKVKRQRRQTVQNLSVMDLQEKMEKCKRGVKRVVSRRNAVQLTPNAQRTISEAA